MNPPNNPYDYQFYKRKQETTLAGQHVYLKKKLAIKHWSIAELHFAVDIVTYLTYLLDRDPRLGYVQVDT